VTVSRQLGLAGAALVFLGAGAVYLAAVISLQGGSVPAFSMNVLVLGGVGLVASVILLMFWRGLRRAAQDLGTQLEKMNRNGRLGTIVMAGADALPEIARPLNALLRTTSKQLEELRSEHQELQIQCRVASAEKKQTEAIIFSISDAVIVTSRFDELVLANEAAEKLLGFELAGSLRKNVDRVISDGTLVRLIRETRAHGRSFTRKVVEHSIDQKGSSRTFNITLSCVVSSDKEVSGVVAVLHDVTREKEIARMKTDFVSNVSHELKSPLASIKAYIEMLVDGEAEDEKTRHEFYGIISSETDRLHRLIENILNISRIESGVVKVVREPISLPGVVKQALDVAAPQAKAKNIELVDRPAPVYHQVEADRDMIYQAVLNLMSNAIKYTPEGGTVTVEMVADERRNVAVCEVTDTGLGIPPEDLPHIFDKFYRVRAHHKAAKGTGLGLTLVKHIIETVHDGKLSVASEKGKGSTFRFELPLIA